MREIVIIGAGGQGRETLGLIQSINEREERWTVRGFYDDGITPGTLVHGFPVLGGIDKLNEDRSELDVAIAIGSSRTRRAIYERLEKRNRSFPALISPHALLLDPETITIGQGTICCAGTIITCDATIGDFTLLNLACTVGHDARIESFCSFMHAVNIAGQTWIKEGVYMGTNSAVINQLTIGANSIP